MKALFLLLAAVLSAMALGQGFDEARSDLYSASIKVAVERAKGTSNLSDIDLLPHERIVVVEEGATYTRVIVVADETADRAALERTLRTWHVAPDGVQMETLGGELVAESWRVRGRFPNTSAERKVELPDVHAAFAPAGEKVWAYVAIPDHGRVGSGEAERGFFVRELQAGETPTFTVSASLHPGVLIGLLASVFVPALIVVLVGRFALKKARETRPVPKWCSEAIANTLLPAILVTFCFAVFLVPTKGSRTEMLADLWGVSFNTISNTYLLLCMASWVIPMFRFNRAISEEERKSREDRFEPTQTHFSDGLPKPKSHFLLYMIGLMSFALIAMTALGFYRNPSLAFAMAVIGVWIIVALFAHRKHLKAEALGVDDEPVWGNVPELADLVNLANQLGKKVKSVTVIENLPGAKLLLAGAAYGQLTVNRRFLEECSSTEMRTALAYTTFFEKVTAWVFWLLTGQFMVLLLGGVYLHFATPYSPFIPMLVLFPINLAIFHFWEKRDFAPTLSMQKLAVRTWHKAAALIGDPEAPVFLLRKQIEEEPKPRRRAALERTLADYQASLPVAMHTQTAAKQPEPLDSETLNQS